MLVYSSSAGMKVWDERDRWSDENSLKQPVLVRLLAACFCVASATAASSSGLLPESFACRESSSSDVGDIECKRLKH